MSDRLPGRPLDAIARDLRAALEAADYHWGMAVAEAVRAGGLLIEAKAQLSHGEWQPWLRQNVVIRGGRGRDPVRTAQHYMRLARHAEEAQRFAHLGVAGALRQLARRREKRPRERQLERFLSTRFAVGVAGTAHPRPDDVDRAASWCVRQGLTRLVGPACDAAVEVAREVYGPEAAERIAARWDWLGREAQVRLESSASEPGDALWDDTVQRAPRWRWTY